MKTVKQHAEYTIFKRRDGRYAVRAKHRKKGKSWINGDEKVEILAKEGLVAKPQSKAEPEPEQEEGAAGSDEAADETASGSE